jgi:hypothetical protein
MVRPGRANWPCHEYTPMKAKPCDQALGGEVGYYFKGYYFKARALSVPNGQADPEALLLSANWSCHKTESTRMFEGHANWPCHNTGVPF